MYWLLDADALKTLEHAHASGFVASAEQQTLVAANAFDASSNELPGILTIAGSTAQINIAGILTPAPDFFAFFFGGGNVTYPEINAALAIADQDPQVKNIVLSIDSNGGAVDGLFETLDAQAAVTKPMEARVVNKAASAAFAIAAQADTIVASNRAVMIGSVGVMRSFNVDPGRVSVASSQAPNKVPDVSTEAGRAQVRVELDAMHELFAGSIAAGRGTTVKAVNRDFGQGAVVLAEDAVRRGMIDAVAGPSLKVIKKPNSIPGAQGGNNNEARTMDIKQLQLEHPSVYAAAVQDGVAQERDRISAHLTMGEASGDMKTALAAAKDGTEMTVTMQSTYMAAGMNRSDVSHRQDDDLEANAGDTAQAGGDDDDAAAKSVLAVIESGMGITVDA